MNSETALRILSTVRAALEARGVEHVALFGSVARNQGSANSDIDVVVTPRSGRRLDLFELGAIQSILEDAFRGRRVDVLIEPVRHAEIKDAIARDRRHAF